MRGAFPWLAAVLCLSACVGPGQRFGALAEATHPRTGATVKVPFTAHANGSDLVGDLDIVFRPNGTVASYSLKSPTARDGSLLVAEVPVLNKDRTAVLGYRKVPVVAQVNTSSAWDALGRMVRTTFSGANNFAGTIMTGMVGLEAAKQAGTATTTAVEVLKP